MIKVNKPGQSMPLVEKRAIESITYSIALAELLLTNELATSIKEVDSKLQLVDVRIKQGKFIEARVPASIVSGTFVDYPITILFSTNTNNTRAAVFSVRVHK